MKKQSINLEWDKAFWNVPNWNPEKIRAAKVMVVGAGALGNEVIKNLTLLNIGHIVVVDFDAVEYSNLAKSILFRKKDQGKHKALAIAENLKEINNNVKTHSIIGDISTDVGLGVIRRMDVVIGCLDNMLARLFINRYCYRLNKIWIDGGIGSLAGQFNVYKPFSSCYECSLTDNDWKVIKNRMGCLGMAERYATLGSIATTPITSSVIAAFQVQEALKVVFDDEEHLMIGRSFHFNGLKNHYMEYQEAPLETFCISHEYYDEEIIEAQELSYECTVRELLTWLAKYFNTEHISVLLDVEIVLEIANTKEKLSSLAVYKNHLTELEEVKRFSKPSEEALSEGRLENIVPTKEIHSIGFDFPYLDKTLKKLGIPFLHILKVQTNEDIHLVELSGDEHLLVFN